MQPVEQTEPGMFDFLWESDTDWLLIEKWTPQAIFFHHTNVFYIKILPIEVHLDPMQDIEDITWSRGDTTFISERWNAENEWNVFQHEKINVVSPGCHVIFCLLYRHRKNTRITISWTNPSFAESI